MMRIILYLLLSQEKKTRNRIWLRSDTQYCFRIPTCGVPILFLLASVLGGWVLHILLFQNFPSDRNSPYFCSWKHSFYCCCHGALKAQGEFPTQITVFKTLKLSPCSLNGVFPPL